MEYICVAGDLVHHPDRHHPPGWCHRHGHGHPIHVLYCWQAIVWGLRNHFPVKAPSADEELAALVVFDKPDVAGIPYLCSFTN